MVSVVHVYNRWSKSEIRCYVDGQMVSGTDMSWLVSSSDVSNAVKYRNFPKLSDTQNIRHNDSKIKTNRYYCRGAV